MFCSMRPDRLLPVLAGLALLLGRPVAAQDFVLRSDASQASVKAAVLPFQGVAALRGTASPSDVVRADLEFSGRFLLVPVPSGIWDSALFSAQGVSVVATGEVRRGSGADDYEIRLALRDAPSREVLVERTYTGRAKDLRRLAHRFSDEAVFQVFGERGIATTRIAYVRTKGRGREIWTMDYDGFGAEPWTQNGSINMSPTWDRDGALVWSSYLGGEGSRLWRQAPGQKARPMLPGVPGMQISASASPQDGEIALASSIDGQTEIWRAMPEGRAVRLTYSPALEVSPSWSPNGQSIAFTSDRTGSPQIYVMDREGSGARRLSWTGGYNDQPAWSPAGDRIAFARMAGGFQILTMATDGSDERWLGPGEQPKWSPDGRHIVFTRRWGARSDLWICDADGSRPRQLTFSGDAFLPAWSR